MIVIANLVGWTDLFILLVAPCRMGKRSVTISLLVGQAKRSVPISSVNDGHGHLALCPSYLLKQNQPLIVKSRSYSLVVPMAL